MEIDARKRACNVPVLAAVIGGALIAASPAPRAQSGLPAPLETYLTKSAHLSDERRALLSGAPVRKLLDSDPSKEVAVLGAVWIAASPSAYVQLIMDIERFERVTLPNSSDFLYWQETQFGLKPTIRISHVLIQETPERTVIASKMLYASHYFWTALEVRVLLPDAARGRGFWFITANRSRSDRLSGFAGRFVRGRVRSEVESGTRAALTATKATLEGLGSAR